MALDSDDRLRVPPPAQTPQAGEIAFMQEQEARRRQRLRSIALAWALFALAVMFFLVTIVRLGANVANRPF